MRPHGNTQSSYSTVDKNEMKIDEENDNILQVYKTAVAVPEQPRSGLLTSLSFSKATVAGHPQRSQLHKNSSQYLSTKKHPLRKDEERSLQQRNRSVDNPAMSAKYTRTFNHDQDVENRRHAIESILGKCSLRPKKKPLVTAQSPSQHGVLSATIDLTSDEDTGNADIVEHAPRSAQEPSQEEDITQSRLTVPILRSVSFYDKEKRTWIFTNRVEEVKPSPDVVMNQRQFNNVNGGNREALHGRPYSELNSLFSSHPEPSADTKNLRVLPIVHKHPKALQAKSSAPRRRGPFDLSDETSDDEPTAGAYAGLEPLSTQFTQPSIDMSKQGSLDHNETQEGTRFYDPNVVGHVFRPNQISQGGCSDFNISDASDDDEPLPDIQTLLQTKEDESLTAIAAKNGIASRSRAMKKVSAGSNHRLAYPSSTKKSSKFGNLLLQIDAACARNKAATLLQGHDLEQDTAVEAVGTASDTEVSNGKGETEVDQPTSARPHDLEPQVTDLEVGPQFPHAWTPTAIARSSDSTAISHVPALAEAIRHTDKAESRSRHEAATSDLRLSSQSASITASANKRRKGGTPQSLRKPRSIKRQVTQTKPPSPADVGTQEHSTSEEPAKATLVSPGPFASALASLDGKPTAYRAPPVRRARKKAIVTAAVNQDAAERQIELDEFELEAKEREKNLEAELKRREDAIAAEKARDERILASQKRQAELQEQIKLRMEEERQLEEKRAEEKAYLLEQKQQEVIRLEAEKGPASEQISEYRGTARSSNAPAAESIASAKSSLTPARKPGLRREERPKRRRQDLSESAGDRLVGLSAAQLKIVAKAEIQARLAAEKEEARAASRREKAAQREYHDNRDDEEAISQDEPAVETSERAEGTENARKRKKGSAEDLDLRPSPQKRTATTAEKGKASGGAKNSFVKKLKNASKRKQKGSTDVSKQYPELEETPLTKSKRGAGSASKTAKSLAQGNPQPSASASSPVEEVVDFETLTLQSPGQLAHSEPDDSGRPTVGGKSMNPEVWRAYLADHGMDADAPEENAIDLDNITASSPQELQSLGAHEQAGQFEDFWRHLRLPSPYDPRDDYHYSFEIVRKNWAKDTDEEDIEWAVCSNSATYSSDKPTAKNALPVTKYAHLHEANAAVDAEAMRDLGDGIVAVGDSADLREYRKDKDGLRQMYFETENGCCRIHVRRVLHTPEQKIKPVSKVGWLPRHAYCVIKRTEVTTVVKSSGLSQPRDEAEMSQSGDSTRNDDEYDDLFDSKAGEGDQSEGMQEPEPEAQRLEPPEESQQGTTTTTSVTQEIVTSHITALEHANYAAAMHCLELMYGLNPRDPAMQAARKEDLETIRANLDELKESGGSWSADLTSSAEEEKREGDRTSAVVKHEIRVWVEEFELVGPRNI